jgi:lantibiotic modifying enzyme
MPPESTLGTRPLLSGTDAAAVVLAVQSIAASLPPPDPSGPAGPSRGSSGYALFWAAYAELMDDDAARATALAHVAAAVEAVGAMSSGAPGLFAAPVGVGWALNALEGHLLDPDPDENDVDHLVVRLLRKESWLGSFDLIRGLVGFGAYALARLPRDAAAEAVALTVRRLGDRAIEHADGLYWTADMALEGKRADDYPDGYVDLGLAHGNAGVVAVLANAYRAGFRETRPLLDGALAWLRARDTGNREGRAFPGLLPVGQEPVPARVAWCYGDPGIAAAFAQAAVALDDDSLREYARAIARGCALRDDHGVVDSGLCHGGAGLTQVFHRLGLALDDEPLRDMARGWARTTLTLRKPTEEGGGFLTWVPSDERYETWTTLLEGSCGVGLALMSTVSGETWWDGLLLIDGGRR